MYEFLIKPTANANGYKLNDRIYVNGLNLRRYLKSTSKQKYYTMTFKCLLAMINVKN